MCTPPTGFGLSLGGGGKLLSRRVTNGGMILKKKLGFWVLQDCKITHTAVLKKIFLDGIKLIIWGVGSWGKLGEAVFQ